MACHTTTKARCLSSSIWSQGRKPPTCRPRREQFHFTHGKARRGTRTRTTGGGKRKRVSDDVQRHVLFIFLGWINLCFYLLNPLHMTTVVQTAWKIGKDAVEAATNLVPGSVPRPIARIGVTIAAVSITLFLLKSILSTAFFVLAMMGLIYLGFLAMNPKEVTGSRMDETSSEDPVEEARRIMEKYK